MKKILFIAFTLFAAGTSFAQQIAKPLYQSHWYSIYPDSIVQQNKFVAIAPSDTVITSNYKSPSKEFPTTKVKFKFTINGKFNEMKAFTDHHYNIKFDGDETPVIIFGEELIDTTVATTLLKQNTRLKIRLNLSPVFNEFNARGFYVDYNGDTLFKNDFKTVYVGGETEPMNWKFDFLYRIPQLELKDDDKDGIYETTVTFNPSEIPQWKLSKNLSAFPQYKSSFAISNALYNLSLEEMENAIEKDSTLRTGIDWPGVWTRDVSYSIILAMAHLQPTVAMNSLLRKVNKKKRIIQDTGSGGSYPVSTDRMIWTTAAWEVYKVTGDKDWLTTIYPIIKNSMDDDEKNIYDEATGLARGESSFLDWRHQTYPIWFEPIDIYTSENLGTNALHYKANLVLAEMAGLLFKNTEATKYKRAAEKIKASINKYLWMPGKGYYGQYRYGKNYKILSPKAEALGEALCVLFDVANTRQQQSIVANTPVTAFGITCIYPQIPGMFPYHNNAIWPFVQSYWALAAAKAGNEKAVMESIAAIYRPAALFLTNKENFVADNGDYSGTAINSSNMLWSLSGNISLVHKIFFGIEFKTNGLMFHPFVPKALADTRTLTNFKYRSSMLDITMVGFGNQVASFLLDGKPMDGNEIPATITGKHSIKIVLSGQGFKEDKINKVSNDIAPPIPAVTYKDGVLSWAKVNDAIKYLVIRNGNLFSQTTQLQLTVTPGAYSEYQVIAVDAKQYQSFASEPLVVVSDSAVNIYQAEGNLPTADVAYKGFTGKGFIEISKTINTSITLPVTINRAGTYAIDFRYANGNGDLGQENKCGIRTLLVDNKKAATMVFPQRGKDVWDNWGFSNTAKIYLTPGRHLIQLSFKPPNENMNIDINQAMIDYMRVTKIE